MNRALTFTSAVAIAALTLPAIPAAAQGNRGGGEVRGGGRAVASRPAPTFRAPSAPAFRAPTFRAPTFRTPSAPEYRAPQAMPRTFGNRSFNAPQAAPRTFGNRSYGMPQAAPRTFGNRTYNAPQAMPRTNGNRTYNAPQNLPRANGNRTYNAPQGGRVAVPRGGTGTYAGRTYQGGRAVPGVDPTYRGGANYRGPGGDRYGNRGHFDGGYRAYVRPGMVRPYFSHPYMRPYNWVPYRPYRFVRPYYVFSPWFSVGFGLWVGYPIQYPWTYLGDYQPTVFGYYGDSGYNVTADMSSYGGLSFDVQPADANVFVDGQYVGTVADFGPNCEPLTLEPGTHRIAIQRAGYQSLEWDVTIEPGQVIPYRGVLNPY